MAVFQSTLGTIRNNVILKLRLDEDQDSGLVDEWINLAYLDALQATGALQKCGVASLTSGSSSYALPVQIAWIKHIVVVYPDSSISLPMQRIRLEKLISIRQGDLASGQLVSIPLYAVAGQDRIEIWPEPSTGQSLKFWYSYLPDELSADADEPALQEPFGSKLLEYGALVEGARFKKDPLIQDYENQYAVWLSRFQAWLNRRQGASSQAFEVWTTSDVGPYMGISWEADR